MSKGMGLRGGLGQDPDKVEPTEDGQWRATLGDLRDILDLSGAPLYYPAVFESQKWQHISTLPTEA